MLKRIAAGLLLALGVLALLPPFFTHGACTAEFEAASDALEHSPIGLNRQDSASTSRPT